jgi:hypothetical protein
MNFVSHCAEDIAGRGEFRGCEGETLALIIGK